MDNYYDRLMAQEKTVSLLKKGEVGYIYPWALTISPFGITVDMECKCLPIEFGTSCVRVQRNDDNQLNVELSRWALDHIAGTGMPIEGHPFPIPQACVNG